MFHSWKEWKWGGLTPFLIFLVYCLSLGFARNSGSRYLVPIDWVIYFYYILGLIYIINFFFNGLLNEKNIKTNLELDMPIERTQDNKYLKILLSTILIGLFLLIPISSIKNKNISPLCSTSLILNAENQKTYESHKGAISLITGQILYPKVKEDQIFATLLICNSFKTINFNSDNQLYNHGDYVVVAFETETSNEIVFISPLEIK